MQSSDLTLPLGMAIPFAINGDKNIPNKEAIGTETSSLEEGFLEITQEPLVDGGIAPERTDFNGMFYLSTDQRVFLQNGGVITYNSNVATVINGYPEGAVLGYVNDDEFNYVRSLHDNNTEDFVSDPTKINGIDWEFTQDRNSVLSILKKIYPVGAIFIGTTSICPMATLFATWELVSTGMALWGGDGTNANTTIAAGLPNITGQVNLQESGFTTVSGCFGSDGTTGQIPSGNQESTKTHLTFNASRSSSIYRNGVTTVQPPAYVVNVWRRSA